MSVVLRSPVDQVLRVLEADWQDPLRCTNVEQAFHRAGVPFEDGKRRRVAGAILEDVRVRDLLRWHPSAYFLTNEERLVARVVLRTLRLRAAAEDSKLVEHGARLLALPPGVVARSLDALRWIGFLEGVGGGVRLAPGASEFLDGVGFYFHEVVAGEERFNVNCFHDFVLLTSPTYRDRRLRSLVRRSDAPGMTPKMLRFLTGIPPQDLVRRPYDRGRVRLNDACASCARGLRLVVEDGRLVAVEPTTVWHVRAGGCGVNNVFCSPGCAAEWVEVHGFRGAERGPVPALWT